MAPPKLEKWLDHASGMRAKGKSAMEALAWFEKKVPEAAELPPASRARYAHLLLDAGRADEALDIGMGILDEAGPVPLASNVRAWIEEHLPRFGRPVRAVDTCWNHHASEKDWDGARALVKHAAESVPQSLEGFRTVMGERARTVSMAPIVHAAFAHISLAERNGREAVQHLRSALAGPPELSAHAAAALSAFERAHPKRLDVRWAVLEAGGLGGDDWIDKAMEAAAQDPQRMIEYLRDAITHSYTGSRSGLLELAGRMTERFPSLPAAWEIHADLQDEDPHGEIRSLTRVVMLEPGLSSARAAMKRIHETADEAPGDLRLQFARVRALLHMSDSEEARGELEPLARIDPDECLRVMAESRAAGVGPPPEFLLIEAGCLHRLGRDVEAAERVRSARTVPALVRAKALAEMRVEAPASPDLATALAEIYAAEGDLGTAREVLTGLLDQAPAAAPAILEWLDGDSSGPLGGEDGAPVLRTRAELAFGRQAEAVGRIAGLFEAKDDHARELLAEVARRRVSAPVDVDLDLEILRMLADSGLDSALALRFLSKLRAEGEAERIIGILGARVPRDAETEREWLHALARLDVDLGRAGEAVSVARGASTKEHALAVLGELLGEVPREERWVVLEGKAGLLIDAGGDAGRVLEILTEVIEDHPARTEAVFDLLDSCPETSAIRADRLFLRARCEEGLGRPEAAAKTYLDAASTAADADAPPLVGDCARRLASLVEKDPHDPAARLCLSRVGTIQQNGEAALAPIRGAPEPTPALFERLDEIHVEFPGSFDALWTSVDWYRETGTQGEAVERLTRLLNASPENAELVRRTAEEIHADGGNVRALFVIAEVDRRGGRPAEELAVCRQLVARDPATGPEVLARLRDLQKLHPADAECFATRIELAPAVEDPDTLLEVAGAALEAPLEPEDAARVAEAVAEASGVGAFESEARYWSLLADHSIRVQAGERAVDACRRIVSISGDGDGEVVRRLVAMRKDGFLSTEGVDLLVELHREAGRADDLAAAIRWRWTDDADPGVLGRLRAAAESVDEEVGLTPSLRSVLQELCLELGDAPRALDHLIANSGNLGPERTLKALAALEERSPDDPRIPLERAVRVLAPRGRAREAALDIERVFDRDPAEALQRGLPCVRGLLIDHGGEPDLLRVLTRLCIREGEGPEALDHLNHLSASGEEFREASLALFGELADRFPALLEARIRWAELLSLAARGAGSAGATDRLWSQCEDRCREVLAKSPSRRDELRTLTLLAGAMEARGGFDKAAAYLREVYEKYPDERAVLSGIRRNHLSRLAHVAKTAEDPGERAAALLAAGRAREALSVIEGADELNANVAAIRAWAHYAAGNYNRVVAECTPFVEDLEAGGRLEPPMPDLLYFLGRSSVRLGDEARGIRFLERLAREYPCHRACRAYLEEFYRRSESGETREIELSAGLEEVKSGQA